MVYSENHIFPIEAISKHKQAVCMRDITWPLTVDGWPSAMIQIKPQTGRGGQKPKVEELRSISLCISEDSYKRLI